MALLSFEAQNPLTKGGIYFEAFFRRRFPESKSRSSLQSVSSCRSTDGIQKMCALRCLCFTHTIFKRVSGPCWSYTGISRSILVPLKTGWVKGLPPRVHVLPIRISTESVPAKPFLFVPLPLHLLQCRYESIPFPRSSVPTAQLV